MRQDLPLGRVPAVPVESDGDDGDGADDGYNEDDAFSSFHLVYGYLECPRMMYWYRYIWHQWDSRTVFCDHCRIKNVDMMSH